MFSTQMMFEGNLEIFGGFLHWTPPIFHICLDIPTNVGIATTPLQNFK